MISDCLSPDNQCFFYQYLDKFDDESGKYFHENIEDLIFQKEPIMEKKREILELIHQKLLERLKGFIDENYIDERNEFLETQRLYERWSNA